MRCCPKLMRIGLTLAVLGLVVGVASVAFAFVVGPRKWPGNQTTFRFNANFEDPPAGSTAEQMTALVESMNQWNGRSNFVFSNGGTTNLRNQVNDGVNNIHYRANSASGGALAVTVTWFGGPTIFDTDIRFYDDFGNGAPIVWAIDPSNQNQYDIEHVAVHEFGHALGLGHSNQQSAIMFAATPPGNRGDVLTFDDMLGLTSLYGHPTVSVLSATPNLIPGFQPPQTVTVTGSGFVPGATRVFLRRNNRQPEDIHELQNVNVLSANMLTGDVPSMPPGSTWPMAVRVTGDQTIRTNNIITYVNPDPPQISSVMPASGAVIGGTQVTILGSGFTIASDMNATIGGNAATIDEVTSPNQLLVTTPAGTALGPVALEVSTSGGMATSTFTYGANPPALVRSGGSGRVGGNVRVEIQGAPNRLCALLGDVRSGSTTKGRLNLGLACTPRFTIIHNSFTGGDLPLDSLGVREVTIPIPNRPHLAFESFFLQGVVSEPGQGVTVTNTTSVTIFP